MLRDIIIESLTDIDTHKIAEFIKKSKSDRHYSIGDKPVDNSHYYSIRDNCGIAAHDYINYMKDNYGNNDLKRVQGTFKGDVPVVTKLDFYPHELTDMKTKGYNPNNKDDRLKYTIDNNLEERQKEIIDPSGKLQFIDSKLSKDLNKNRYKAD